MAISPLNFYTKFAKLIQTYTIIRTSLNTTPVVRADGLQMTPPNKQQTTTFTINGIAGSRLREPTNEINKNVLDSYEVGFLYLQTTADLYFKKDDNFLQDIIEYDNEKYIIFEKTTTDKLFDDGAGNFINLYKARLK